MDSPPQRPAHRALTVVGGGVIGLTCALTAADAGWRVRVLDAGTDERASWVAGGMLGSLGEGHPGEDASLALSVESVRLWPALVKRLDDPGVVTATDSLFVAASATDIEYLRHLADFVWAGQPATDAALQSVTGRDIRTLEPPLSSRLVGGYRAVGEWSVDNRRLLEALRAAATSAGAELVSARVESLADLDDLGSDTQILLAAGLGTAALWPGVHLHAAKGEILRLRRTRWSVPPPGHVVRARLHGRAVYLVPREGGVVVGATQYEAEGIADRAPQAGGVADLLADAIEVFPGLRTYELTEAGAGLRPCTADGLPIVTRVDTRTVVATGHGRNGIVLAPGTAARVLSILEGAEE
ncbi:glycine oxidase ThiO [Gordonia hongkongensis]|uniref:glycine oxidase n=1 Tax=Gordonia hongkongensis TaxID=1701090 RepID=A0AAX3T6H3_9ACTN|nr:glycine oxidase ThiO [Gordonia hongkongensis]MDF6101358.1 glycine oxidase ThiO [Gordonia hongkongensis]QIK46445.1 glycine oxidase ThiO [Gordonia terrae]WFP24565.1 glycine oxidase ThiO [Gordonia hongkongensis]